jgi:hypothetical protein
MSVLALVHMRGNTDRLLEASDRLSEAFGMPDGLIAQVTAPTDEGIVLMQLWESDEHRMRANDDPNNREALQASGLLRETISGSAEVCVTDRVKFADVVAAPRTSRKRTTRARRYHVTPRGRSSMAEQEPSKLKTGVRFSSPASGYLHAPIVWDVRRPVHDASVSDRRSVTTGLRPCVRGQFGPPSTPNLLAESCSPRDRDRVAGSAGVRG